MKKMGREEKYRKESKEHRFWYNVLNAVLGTFVFVLIYKIWLEDENNFLKIWLTMVLTGIFVSWTLRILCHYWGDKNVNGQEFLTHLFISIFYAVIIWFGIIRFMFIAITNIWWLLLTLFFTKMFIFLFSDWLADKITFGG